MTGRGLHGGWICRFCRNFLRIRTSHFPPHLPVEHVDNSVCASAARFDQRVRRGEGASVRRQPPCGIPRLGEAPRRGRKEREFPKARFGMRARRTVRWAAGGKDAGRAGIESRYRRDTRRAPRGRPSISVEERPSPLRRAASRPRGSPRPRSSRGRCRCRHRPRPRRSRARGCRDRRRRRRRSPPGRRAAAPRSAAA